MQTSCHGEIDSPRAAATIQLIDIHQMSPKVAIVPSLTQSVSSRRDSTSTYFL